MNWRLHLPMNPRFLVKDHKLFSLNKKSSIPQQSAGQLYFIHTVHLISLFIPSARSINGRRRKEHFNSWYIDSSNIISLFRHTPNPGLIVGQNAEIAHIEIAGWPASTSG